MKKQIKSDCRLGLKLMSRKITVKKKRKKKEWIEETELSIL